MLTGVAWLPVAAPPAAEEPSGGDGGRAEAEEDEDEGEGHAAGSAGAFDCAPFGVAWGSQSLAARRLCWLGWPVWRCKRASLQVVLGCVFQRSRTGTCPARYIIATNALRIPDTVSCMSACKGFYVSHSRTASATHYGFHCSFPGVVWRLANGLL